MAETGAHAAGLLVGPSVVGAVAATAAAQGQGKHLQSLSRFVALLLQDEQLLAQRADGLLALGAQRLQFLERAAFDRGPAKCHTTRKRRNRNVRFA